MQIPKPIFLFLAAILTVCPAAPVPVRSLAVTLNRNVAPVALEAFAGAPISITGTLPAGQDFTGITDIRAELHTTASNSETPLAVSDDLETLPAGNTATLTFTSAKMNRATGKYFLSIYATYADSRLEVFRVAEIRLSEGGASQLTPPAPSPALYVTQEDFDALELRFDELEEGGGGGGGGATNLTYTASPTNGIVVSSSGTDATLPLGTGTNAGLLAPAQFTKLANLSGTNSGDQDLSSYATTSALTSGLAGKETAGAAATAQAFAIQRANHTGTQSYTTITGLGTLATQSGTFSGTSSGANTGDQDLSGYVTTIAGNAAYQPLDSDLTSIAALTTTSYGRSVLTLADASALRASAALVPGTNVQAFDADLSLWAAITPGTGVGTALAVNIGSAGAFITNGGAAGTPSSLGLDNATGLRVTTKITGSSYTIGTTSGNELYGGVLYVTGAATLTIPAVASGASFTVITMGAVAVSVDPNAADLIYLDGVALADGDKITNLSTAGDIAVFTYYDGTGWAATTNGWTDGN